MIIKRFALCLCVLALAAPLLAQDGGRATAEATVKGKKIAITYGRPSLQGKAVQGRDIFTVANVGTVWRVGRNEATEIETAGDLLVKGKELKAGKYSLWAKKTGENEWVLAFHPKTGVWGAPPLTDGYVAELPLKVERIDESADLLTIAVKEKKNKKGAIKIHWGNAMLTGVFEVR